MKKTITRLTLLALIGLSNITNGQAPNWDWAKSAGSTGNENSYSTATDALGNVYVTGTYTSPIISFGATTLTNAGNNDIFVVKYDASGNIIWAKNVGGTGNDFSNGIATDASGNVNITGGYASPSIIIGADTLTNAGTTDIIVIKFDASGNILWAKDEGGTGSEFSQSVTADSSGNVYITGGYTSAALTIGVATLTNTSGFGGSNVFIVKYDPSGNVLWVRGAGGNVFDNKGQGLTTDASGNLYVIGYFDYPAITFGSITVSNSGGLGVLYDMFLVKYDPSGNVLWAKGAGSPGDQRGASTSTDASGNVYVTGFYNGPMNFGTITLTNAGGIDLFIAKYDTSGNVLWAQRAGGTGDDYCQSSTTDASGNLYVTGYYNSPFISFGSSPLLVNTDGFGVTNDMFLVKYDAPGNVLWSMTEGGGFGNDRSYSTTTDSNGNVYVTGGTNSAITFGATTLTTSGGSDMFIAKLGITTGINDNTINNEVIVYPNPTTGLLLLSNNYNVTLMDLTGKIIAKEQNTNAIDISSQTAGMYFLLLTDNKGKIVQRSKVMKE